MAIEGFFYPRQRSLASAPYVRAAIEFPRLRKGGQIRFLIDTGSYASALHYHDISRFGMDFGLLNPDTLKYSDGIGGSTGYYSEPAWLLFLEPDGTRRFCELDIHISQEAASPEAQDLPSLLGRDFLNLCALTVDRFNDIVRLEPHNVTEGFVLPPVPA